MPLRTVVVEPDGTGGLQHFAFEMCDALARSDCQVSLVTSTDCELANVPRTFELRATLHLWPVVDNRRALSGGGFGHRLGLQIGRVPRALRLVRAWNRLSRNLIAEAPDVVFVGRVHFALLTLYLRRMRRHGLTLVQVCHEFDRRDSGRMVATAHRHLSRNMYRHFSAIFFLSKSARAEFLAGHDVDPRRTHTIPHGNGGLLVSATAEPERARARYSLGGSERVVLFFGRLRPSKGLDDLVDAFAVMPKDSVKLLIVGFPTKQFDLAGLHRRVEALHLGNTVIIDPRYVPLREVPSLLAMADLVVLPYRNATQSGVAHLAYSAGRPVVATAVGGLAEDVEHGRSGLLVPPGSPRALASAMTQLLTDPSLATSMGARALELAATKHSWNAVAARIVDVCRDLPDNRQEAHAGDDNPLATASQHGPISGQHRATLRFRSPATSALAGRVRSAVATIVSGEVHGHSTRDPR